MYIYIIYIYFLICRLGSHSLISSNALNHKKFKLKYIMNKVSKLDMQVIGIYVLKFFELFV